MKKIAIIVLLTAALSRLNTVPLAYADALPSAAADIVYVVDVSGSVEQTDGGNYVSDALKLGIDLAPENSRIALIGVNTGIAFEYGLTDVSTNEGRAYIKERVNRLQYTQDTDFSIGFERALEILGTSDAQQKRVIFLGDFSEGGYNVGSKQMEAEAAVLIEHMAEYARTENIAIDLLLWGTAPQGSLTAPKFLALSEETGGRLIQLSEAKQAPPYIEEIYFKNYDYRFTMLNVLGDGGRDVAISMPTNNIRRARVYVSARYPIAALNARYPGAALEGEHNRSYAMIDLVNPSKGDININLAVGSSGRALIYTMFEYGSLSVSTTVVNAATQPEGVETAESSGAESQYNQSTEIFAEIVDAETGKPLLSAPYPEDAVFNMTVVSPTGAVLVDNIQTAPIKYIFNPYLPEDFGTYQIMLSLTVGGLEFGPFSSSIEVPDVRPEPESPPEPIPEPPIDWRLIISLSMCGFLFLAALIIAFLIRRNKKREAEFVGATEMATEYKFHGKLSVYALILDSGQRELRPFDFSLHAIKEKRVTLRDILNSVGAADTYAGAEDIIFLVGPEESLIVRNNSKAVLKILGHNYESRSKAQVFYGQKMYIIIDKDENELEINYKRAKEEDPNPVYFNVRTR